jgi:hypothetical protein
MQHALENGTGTCNFVKEPQERDLLGDEVEMGGY